MNKKIYIKIGIITITVFLITWIYFATKKIRSSAVIKENLYTEIEINPTTLDLDTINVETEKIAYFIVKNVGKNPLQIKYIDSPCGCSKPIYDINNIDPDSTTTIQINFYSTTPGPFSKKLLLFCNTEQSTHPLIISGYVK